MLTKEEIGMLVAFHPSTWLERLSVSRGALCYTYLDRMHCANEASERVADAAKTDLHAAFGVDSSLDFKANISIRGLDGMKLKLMEVV